MDSIDVSLAKLSPGSTQVAIREIEGRKIVWISSRPTSKRGALSEHDGHKIAQAAKEALKLKIPLVLVMSTSGASINDGVAALHGWGLAAKAISDCSGIVPILAGLTGPAVSGPALLLGLADYVVVAPGSFAYLSGPSMVEGYTGVSLTPAQLGGPSVHLQKTGVAYEEVDDRSKLEDALMHVLQYLPQSTDELPLRSSFQSGPSGHEERLREIIPSSPSASYDVRDIIGDLCDLDTFLEIRAEWAPQLVVGLGRIEGRPVGFLANQPRIMAGTLDIPAAQKGARFVRFCDAFNLPLITLVDTPGFLPGKDVEWRGMIRHGAELAFSYAACGVPRICVITRKAYGGAYIVMDSKGMGNDLTLAWPSAEIAVMGAQGAVQILYRKSTEEERAELQRSYEETHLTPWIAAERGFVDNVIDPGTTKEVVAKALELLMTKKEHIRNAKHANSPM